MHLAKACPGTLAASGCYADTFQALGFCRHVGMRIFQKEIHLFLDSPAIAIDCGNAARTSLEKGVLSPLLREILHIYVLFLCKPLWLADKQNRITKLMRTDGPRPGRCA